MFVQKQDITPSTLCAILDYLSAELADAQTTEELTQIMEVAKVLLLDPAPQDMVRGIPHISARMDASHLSPAQKKNACTVHLEVPFILSDAFKDLSSRMNTLQDQDPETFSNAASALYWLAQGELTTN